ncbi:MAG TPA: nickel insertion protein, partial [Candidatus Acidoferrum sp.]|nr:nickel insertion protein [Candidatus Acidoferrum sp.]
AAILAVGARFQRPAMSLRSVGYGIGTRESPGNVLAVWVGDRVEPSTGVTLIETNLDDMAPNLIAPLCEDLMSAGALDVTVTPTLMKKGRPGHLVSVLSPPELAGKLAEHLLRHSTTLGVRVTGAHRVTAQRRTIEVKTHLGTARVKVKEFGGKPVDASPEYEDCRLISLAKGIDLREVMRVVTEAARKELGLS